MTWPISLLAASREVAHLPAQGALQVGAAVGARVFARTARIFGSASAIARTRLDGQLCARPAGCPRPPPGPALPGWSAGVVAVAGRGAAGACSRRVAVRGARPVSERPRQRRVAASALAAASTTSVGSGAPARVRDAAPSARGASGEGAGRAGSAQAPEVREHERGDVADRPLRGLGRGQLDPAEDERAERVATRAASRGCRRRRAPGGPSR